MRSRDRELEDEIDRAAIMLGAAKCLHARSYWAKRLEELVAKRSAERVREMEHERGLA